MKKINEKIKRIAVFFIALFILSSFVTIYFNEKNPLKINSESSMNGLAISKLISGNSVKESYNTCKKESTYNNLFKQWSKSSECKSLDREKPYCIKDSKINTKNLICVECFNSGRTAVGCGAKQTCNNNHQCVSSTTPTPNPTPQPEPIPQEPNPDNQCNYNTALGRKACNDDLICCPDNLCKRGCIADLPEEEYNDNREMDPPMNSQGPVCKIAPDLCKDQKCLNKEGTCQDIGISCLNGNGYYEKYLCGGGINRQCCLPYNDRKCIDKGGTCQDKSLSCNNGEGHYETGLCGGGINRQCCLEGKKEEIYQWHKNIIATYFDGSGATAGNCGNSCVALPAPIAQTKNKKVEVCNEKNGICITAKVGDVGPWCTKDIEYVFGNSRPFAETHKGKLLSSISGNPSCNQATSKSNGAGIDLTKNYSDKLGIGGYGIVKWRFVS